MGSHAGNGDQCAGPGKMRTLSFGLGDEPSVAQFYSPSLSCSQQSQSLHTAFANSVNSASASASARDRDMHVSSGSISACNSRPSQKKTRAQSDTDATSGFSFTQPTVIPAINDDELRLQLPSLPLALGEAGKEEGA